MLYYFTIFWINYKNIGLSVILIPLIVLALFTGCPTKSGGGGESGSFTYDGQSYSLSGAGVEHFSNEEQWIEISIVCSGINVPEWTGTGTWLQADWILQNSGDYLTISVSGSTYTFEFSLTMTDGRTVTGSFTGSITMW